MKMNSKLRRINIDSRSAYETTKFSQKPKTYKAEYTKEDLEEIEKLDEYHRTIFPWTQYFSEKKKLYYFYNKKTEESAWELPENIKNLADLYFEKKAEHNKKLQEKNYSKFLDPKFLLLSSNSNFKQTWKEKPARIQKENKFNQEIAYKEGDEEYNIWYDKKIEDEIIPQRDAALTKCNPITDCGFTKADKYEKNRLFFCFHFARGNCFLGQNCSFYHHVPELEECLKIDNSKDIFGRSRFGTHRKDKMGIGNFLKETRTLRVSDFCIPQDNENFVVGAYEVLWRHFSLWGNIEDIFLLPTDNIAYIRYEHRCMAEFAKQALSDQTLDSDEILTIKWSENDCFEVDQSKFEEFQETVKIQEEKNSKNKIKDKKRTVHFVEKKKKRTMKEYDKEMEQILELENEFKKKSNDPSKVLVEAEFTLLEQRFKQQAQDQDRLQKSLKKVKKETFNGENQEFDFEKIMNEINRNSNKEEIEEDETQIIF